MSARAAHLTKQMMLPSDSKPCCNTRRPIAIAPALCAMLPALCAMLLSACASSKQPKRPESKAFMIDGPRVPLGSIPGGIQLFARAGNIRVRTESDAWIERTYSVCAEDVESANAIAQMVTVGSETRPDGLTRIDLVAPTTCPIEKLAADSMLALPRGADIDLRTVNGIIDTSGHDARRATLRTTDGNLIVGKVQSELRFSTHSGRVELLGQVREASGKTYDGEILVNTVAPGSRYVISSESGSCRVHLAHVVSAEVIYRTKRGTLRVEIENGGVERRAVPRADDWTERRLLVHGATPVASPTLIVVESRTGDLVLTRPPTGRPSAAPPPGPSREGL